MDPDDDDDNFDTEQGGGGSQQGGLPDTTPDNTPTPQGGLPDTAKDFRGASDNTPSLPADDGAAAPPRSVLQKILDFAGKAMGFSDDGSQTQPEGVPTTQDQQDQDTARDPRKQLMNFLSRSNAMSLDTKNAIENKVDPPQALSGPSRAMETVKYAANTGGMDAGLGAYQRYAAEYDPARSFAAVALDHGNVSSALDAANRAFKSVPSDESVQFAQGPGPYITATVMGKNGAVNAFRLAPNQLSNLLKGQAGQFENVVHNGVQQALTSLVTPRPSTPSQPTRSTQAPAKPQGPNYTNDTSDRYPGMKGPIPGGGYRVGGGYGFGDKNGPPSYPEEQLARGPNKPLVTPEQQTLMRQAQGLGIKDPGAWVTQQQQAQAERANKLDIVKQQGQIKQNTTEANITGRKDVANTNVAGRLTQEGMRGDTQRYITDERGNNYHERSILQAKAANDKLLQQGGQAAAKEHAGLRNMVLNDVLRGDSTADQADEILKKNGEPGGLKALLAPYQVQTQAPQGGNTPVQGTVPGGKYVRDKSSGKIVWQAADGSIRPVTGTSK